MKSKDFSLYSGLVLVMFLWGLAFVFFKIAFESFRPISIIMMRLVVSVVFIYLAARLLKKLQKVSREHFKYLVLMAFFEPFLYFLGESFGLVYVSSTLASVMVATIPLIVPIAAYFIFNERLSRLNIFGLFISTLGVIAVVLAVDAEWGATLKGIILMFLAVLSATGYTLLSKKLSSFYNGFTITIWQNIFGVFMFLPIFLIWDFKVLINTVPSANSIYAVLYLAIFGSSVTFIIFTRAVRELGAAKANIFANMIPVFTAIASFFLLKEEMPLLKILGIAIVLIGLVLSQLKSLKRKGKKVTIPENIPI
ncbi:MAG: DMT family transporter [Bacteroidales bacterium]|nr:DMT family transporter [Bacteroidales bacterium]MCF8391120.1 DMT family transporter [Bacteroidales bacterium]